MLGLIVERESAEGLLWNQTSGAEGLHETPEGSFLVRAGWAGADRVLVFGTPIPEGGGVRPGRVARLGRKVASGLLGSGEGWERLRRCEMAWERLFDESGLERERVSCLFYEPPTMVSDEAYEAARRWAGAVYGPDDRATVRTRLPVLWTVEGSAGVLRASGAAAKSMRAVAVTSGKALTPGHEARLGFLGLLRDRGVPFDLYGRDLPSELGGLGEVASKSGVYRGSAYAIAIENYAEGRHYVSEKLWDALLCWCVPLYWGSGALDRMIPEEAVIRLPDLGEGGVACVLGALADPDAYASRLEAVAEARRRILGDLRMVEWARHKVMGIRRGPTRETA